MTRMFGRILGRYGTSIGILENGSWNKSYWHWNGTCMPLTHLDIHLLFDTRQALSWRYINYVLDPDLPDIITSGPPKRVALESGLVFSFFFSSSLSQGSLFVIIRWWCWHPGLWTDFYRRPILPAHEATSRVLLPLIST